MLALMQRIWVAPTQFVYRFCHFNPLNHKIIFLAIKWPHIPDPRSHESTPYCKNSLKNHRFTVSPSTSSDIMSILFYLAVTSINDHDFESLSQSISSHFLWITYIIINNNRQLGISHGCKPGAWRKVPLNNFAHQITFTNSLWVLQFT